MRKAKRKIIAFALSLAMVSSILSTNIALAAEVESDPSVEHQEKISGEENTDGQTKDTISEENPDAQAVDQEIQTEEDQQAAVEPKLQYLYVDSPYITTPDTQKIMVSFQEGVELDAVSLVYENVETGEQYEAQAGEVQDATAVFSIEYMEEQATGIYHLLKVRAITDDITDEIDLDEIGIVSRYGVNKECETEPDAVVEEQSDSSETRSVNDPGTSANILTYDVSGELVENESVGEAVTEASQGVRASKARTVEEPEKSGDLIVVLDPGHGGFDPGAIGVNNAKEKDLTLKIAQYCKAELEQYGGVTVYMTRTADENVGDATSSGDSLTKRVEYAKEKNADVLVSFHLNSANTSARGAEVYYPNSNYNAEVGSEGKNLAQKIQNELVGLGLSNRGIKIRNSANNSTYPDGSLQDYYGLIWQSKRAGFPAIIIEHAFIDNVNDYNQYLSSDAKLQSLGIADATGIAAAYGLSKGKWIQDNKGWQYQYADGSCVKDSWASIGNTWYHFDKNGYMQTGWFTEGSAKYYLDPVNGDMKTGWQLLDDKWYYFNASGVMVTGWQWVGNVCYYFDTSGVMLTDTWVGDDYVDSSGAWVPGKVKEESGWIQSGGRWWYRHSDGSYTRSNWELINGHWYYFDGSGWMVTGWRLIAGNWYYMDGSGVMVTGWNTIGGNKYYMNGSGVMVTGWQWIGDKCYYFDGSGAMAADTWIENYYVDTDGVWIPGKTRDQWILSGGRWWYRHADGSYTKSAWEQIGGQWYYFDEAGWMVTGWRLIAGSWYYMNGSGVRLTNWQWIGNTCYYFDESGKMAADTWIGDYYVDASGAWIPGKVRQESRWIQSGNKWWYRHADGSYTKSAWEQIGGQWYYFDEAGWMVTGWLDLGDARYFMDESGAMHKGWLDDNGHRYYMNPTAGTYGAEGMMTRGYREIEGQWYYFNKGSSPEGALDYEGVTSIMGDSSLGDKDTAISKMTKLYIKSGKEYPTEELSEGGASDIEQFCVIVYEEAVDEGVKPEVVFAQAMLETGYLQFGGDVKAEQFNFAGLGATGGVPGESFDNVREGIRAQVQHLKAYASSEDLNNPLVDTRFQYVTRNIAPYVEWHGKQENSSDKGWAVSLKYGIVLMRSYIMPLYTM